MTELSQTVFNKYQIRKNKKQKTEFIRYLQAQIPQLQVEAGGFPKCRNLLLGNPDTAKIILGAHYDTCAVMPAPNFITPRNMLWYLVYQFGLVAVIFLFAAAVEVAVILAFGVLRNFI